jgi:pimeloyl-ACP methyl ester carboxylesterase
MAYYKFRNKNIFYEDQGSGPCLFYVHEWNSSSLLFRKLNQKFFDKKFRIISIDLPGYGNSEFVEGLQFDDFSDIILELLNYLQIQQCTLMGFCLGTPIILNFKQRFPERVNFLILIEPVIKFPNILIPLLIPKFGVAFLKYLTTHRFLFNIVIKQLTGKDKRLNEQILKGIEKTDPQISVRYLKLLFRKNNHTNFRNLDFNIQDNCLCITGKNTNFLFKKNATHILNRFSIREFIFLKDTGHFVLIEQPAEVARVILNHLEKLECCIEMNKKLL